MRAPAPQRQPCPASPWPGRQGGRRACDRCVGSFQLGRGPAQRHVQPQHVGAGHQEGLGQCGVRKQHRLPHIACTWLPIPSAGCSPAEPSKPVRAARRRGSLPQRGRCAPAMRATQGTGVAWACTRPDGALRPRLGHARIPACLAWLAVGRQVRPDRRPAPLVLVLPLLPCGQAGGCPSCCCWGVGGVHPGQARSAGLGASHAAQPGSWVASQQQHSGRPFRRKAATPPCLLRLHGWKPLQAAWPKFAALGGRMQSRHARCSSTSQTGARAAGQARLLSCLTSATACTPAAVARGRPALLPGSAHATGHQSWAVLSSVEALALPRSAPLTCR